MRRGATSQRTDTPEDIKRHYEAPASTKALVAKTRLEIRRILEGADDRALLICGPCSIHDVNEGLEYARRLATLSSNVADAVLVVMRTYLEKPRTTLGWKGLMHDPALDGSCDVDRGIKVSREFLIRVNEIGIPCAYECLDVVTPAYIADLVSWVAIGARTVQSQVHRQLASGLCMPVGFKNATTGDVSVAADALVASSSAHRFLDVSQDGTVVVVTTTGNKDTHVILRGGTGGPNYDKKHVEAAVAILERRGLRTNLMIDCSHGNSGKNHERQPIVCEDIRRQIASGSTAIVGLMIESNLLGGRQDICKGTPLAYGKSITDACVSFATTRTMVLGIADAVRARRGWINR